MSEEDTRAVLASAAPPSGVAVEAWEAYKDAVRAVGVARAVPPAGHGVRVPPATTPKDVVARYVDHPNTRCVNVQQPWASLIAMGVKDVENRSQPLAHNGSDEPFCWVAIVASSTATIPKTVWRARLRDVARRLAWNGDALPTLPQDKEAYPSQAVVAMAKLACSSPKVASFAGKASVWNHGDVYAWEVLEVHALVVPFGKGFQTPSVYLTPRGKAKEGHVEAMARVRAAVRAALGGE